MSMNNGSLSQLKARTGSIGKEMARLKAGGGNDTTNQSFRLARVGPGWVLGSIEAVSGMQHPGSLIAGMTFVSLLQKFSITYCRSTLTPSFSLFRTVTPCCLHYISYKKIEEIEEDNPRLVLKLHKLLSYLMAKRQEVTIGQLSTLHSIMSSPAQKKPVGRGDSTHLSHISSFYN
jgi:CRP-like cAMP-binding protein